MTLQINEVIEILMARDSKGQLYSTGNVVLESAKAVHSPDTVAIVGADYPVDGKDDVSTPIQIIKVEDGVVMFLQDDEQISVTPRQLQAIAEYANSTGVDQ